MATDRVGNILRNIEMRGFGYAFDSHRHTITLCDIATEFSASSLNELNAFNTYAGQCELCLAEERSAE